MKFSVVVLFVCLCFAQAFAQGQKNDDDDGQCLTKCLEDLQQRAPKLDAATVLSIGHIRSGNQTVVCPKYDAHVMNTTCGPYRDATICLAKCPNGPVKTLSTSGFAPLQLICIDRQNEVEQHMPCISENCISVEAMCQPKCGSFDDISKDVMELLHQFRGSISADQPPPSVDPTNFTVIIDHACEAIECYADCSRDPTTAKCGKDAYNLEMETVWTIFASMIQSMSSIGLSTPWPESCNTLKSRSATWSKSTGTGAPIPVEPKHEATIGGNLGTPGTPEPNDQDATKSNSVDQFIHKHKDDEIVVNQTETTTQKCHGTACGSASGLGASASTMFFCALMAVWFWK